MSNIFRTMPVHEVFMYQLTLSENVKIFKDLLEKNPEDRQGKDHLARNTQLLKWCEEILREEDLRQEEAMGLHQTM